MIYISIYRFIILSYNLKQETERGTNRTDSSLCIFSINSAEILY